MEANIFPKKPTITNKYSTKNRVLNFFKNAPGEYNTKTLCVRCGEPRINNGTMRWCLTELVKDGLINRPQRGFYSGIKHVPLHQKFELQPRIHNIQLTTKPTNTPILPLNNAFKDPRIRIGREGFKIGINGGGEAWIQIGKNESITMSISKDHPGFSMEEMTSAIDHLNGWCSAHNIHVDLRDAEITQHSLNWDSRLPVEYEVPTRRLSFKNWFIQIYGYQKEETNNQRLEVVSSNPTTWDEILTRTQGGMIMNQVQNILPVMIKTLETTITEAFREGFKQIIGELKK